MSTGTPTTTTTEDATTQTLKDMAASWAHPVRSPVLGDPADVGLEFEDVTFPAQDGVPLEAWFIPRDDSDQLIIANHPLMFNRYGAATHLEPWRSFGAAGGNTFEVNYIEDYRVLHDAGYNVLTYDERNLGLSGVGNGLNSGGRFEARDVIGSLNHVRDRDDLRHMTVGLFSRCQGANATMFAMYTHPELFTDVRCLVAAQPLSVGVTMLRDLERMGIPERIDDLDRQIQLAASVTLGQMTPTRWATRVRVPTFVYQVHDDLMTRPHDVQTIFDNIPTSDKKLQWIHGTSARWDGYLEFQRRPAPMLEWFSTHMS